MSDPAPSFRNLPRVVFNDERGTHVIFDTPVNRGNFKEACQSTIAMAKVLCGSQLSVAVNFYALGVEVQVTERSNADAQQLQWEAILQNRQARIPFMLTTDDACEIRDSHEGSAMSQTWKGVCTAGPGKFWYIGRSYEERSFHVLKASEYLAACAEAEALRNMELIQVGPLPSGWQPEANGAKNPANGQFALGSGQVDHILRLASLLALRRAGDHAALKGKGATSAADRALQELRTYLESLTLTPEPQAHLATVGHIDGTSLDLAKLRMLVDCARTHIGDIREGLDDGEYAAHENEDFSDKQDALAHVEAWLESVDPSRQHDVAVRSAGLSWQVESRHSLRGSELESLRHSAAERVHMHFDLGDGVLEVDESGWERVTPGDEWSRTLFVEVSDGAASDVDPTSVTLTMVVRFEPGSDQVIDAYARDAKGNDWGHLPDTWNARRQAPVAKQADAAQAANDGLSI